MPSISTTARLMESAANRLIGALLRSPFHSLLSGSFAVIHITGMRSGKVYAVPVNYIEEGPVLRVVSRRRRTWWRNVRGGAPIVVRLRGRVLRGWATTVETPGGVVEGLRAVLRAKPGYAGPYHVALDPEGNPRADDLARAATKWLIVEISELTPRKTPEKSSDRGRSVA